MQLDSYDGRLARIVHHAPAKFGRAGSKFLIGRTTSGITVKGIMRSPVEGEEYRFWGRWVAQKGRFKDDGDAFEFVSYDDLLDMTADGIGQYLMRHVPEIGPVRSRAVVEAFGKDTLAVLRSDPGRLAEVPGITDRVVEAVREFFARSDHKVDPNAYAKVSGMFAGKEIKVSQVTIEDIVVDFGSDAPEVLRENPYRLLDYPRIGWKTADAFALSVVEYAPAGIERHKAAVLEALTRLAVNQGHTYGSRPDVEAVTFTLIGDAPRPEAWEALRAAGKVAAVTDRWGPAYALANLRDAERTVARQLRGLGESARPLPCRLADGDDDLTAAQRTALGMIEREGVCLLVGAPGTGKSYTIARAVAKAVAGGVRAVRVVAPTGKAAKRSAELLAQHGVSAGEVPATTIHKALASGFGSNDDEEGVPASSAKFGRGRDEFGFARNEDRPLEVDFLIVDETSMVDVKLMAALLRAVAPGTRVVFVGDHNQLPSVGPGSVLRDMLEAGLPTVELRDILRSDGGGRVVRACHAIKDGLVPEPAPRASLPTENWYHVEAEDARDVAREIVELHRPYRNFPDPVWDLQVITPQKHKLPVACEALNNLLCRKLNPRVPAPSDDPEAGESFGPKFFPGDKVVRTKNGPCDRMVPIADPAGTPGGATYRVDWRWQGRPYRLCETYVVNGDMGGVEDIVTDDDAVFVVVRFRSPDRLCRLPFGDCHLQQAYAMTCHKAQGSGFPFVIVPVHSCFWWDSKTESGLFNREWIYTAVSRAEQLLVTVGQFSAIRAAVGRKTVHRRKTQLLNDLKSASASPLPARPKARAIDLQEV